MSSSPILVKKSWNRAFANIATWARGPQALRLSWFIRGLVFALFIAAYLIVPPLIDKKNKMDTGLRHFVYRLPSSSVVAECQGLSENPELERVYISGHFSKWQTDNPDFQMVPQPDGKSWSIDLHLPKGLTSYLFVLYPRGASSPLWVNDESNPDIIKEGLGYNSVIKVGSGLSSSLFKNIFGICAVLLVVYTLLEILLRRLRKTRLNATVRALIVFSLVVVLAGFSSAFYVVNIQRGLARRAYHELADMVYLFLAGSGFDFSNLDSADVEPEAARSLDAFLRYANINAGSVGFSGGFSSITRIVLFNAQGRTVSVTGLDKLPLAPGIQESLGKFQDVYADSVFRDIFQALSLPESDLSDSHFGLMPSHHWKDNAAFRRGSRLLGFNSMLRPVMKDLRPQAYIGLMFEPQFYGEALGLSIIVILCGAIIVLGFCVFLFLFKPVSQVLDPALVKDFAQRHGLTPREVEILPLVAAGKDYKAIADILFISLNTVHTHIYSIFRKSGVANRLALMDAILKRS